MTNKELSIRKMRQEDLADLMRLKNEEGWNQTPSDGAILLNYPKGVNLVLEQENKIVGTVTGINYANKVAWIGMMLIDKNYRGRGLGKALLKEAISRLIHCDSIKLDATPAGERVYIKMGFQKEHTLIRWTHPKINKVIINSLFQPIRATIRDLTAIAEIDEPIFGANRAALLKYLYNNSPELAWVIKEEDKIKGFCLGRIGHRYTQIGPVCAPTEKMAMALISAALNQLEGKTVVVDLIADKNTIENYLKLNGFSAQRPLKRMYLDHNPHPGVIGNYYLICGPEFG